MTAPLEVVERKIRAALDRENTTGMDGQDRAIVSRIAALAVTPVPQLACPRCGVGHIEYSDAADPPVLICRLADGAVGCGARWDLEGEPE